MVREATNLNFPSASPPSISTCCCDAATELHSGTLHLYSPGSDAEHVGFVSQYVLRSPSPRSSAARWSTVKRKATWEIHRGVEGVEAGASSLALCSAEAEAMPAKQTVPMPKKPHFPVIRWTRGNLLVCTNDQGYMFMQKRQSRGCRTIHVITWGLRLRSMC